MFPLGGFVAGATGGLSQNPVRVDTPWADVTNTNTLTGTLTVPPDSGAILRFDITATTGAPAPQYNWAGGGFTSFADNDTLSVTDLDTLVFRNNAGASSYTLQVYDHVSSIKIGAPFTVTRT